MKNLLLPILLFFAVACGPTEVEVIDDPIIEVGADQPEALVEDVLTEAEQEALSPDSVVAILRAGNDRFMSNDLTHRDHSAAVRQTTHQQYPKAVILGCIDSRVPVEDVFDRGIGDIFVARVAGNFINEDILGSMEYACKVAGSKLVLVMGHENCGAVKAAVDGVEMGNITPMLQKIKPAVNTVAQNTEGEVSSKNEALVHDVCVQNVQNAIANIRSQSSILNEMEQQGKIKVLGAVYDMDTGEVNFM